MITFVLAVLATALLLLSVSYRHALLFAKATALRVVLVSLFFAAMNALMAWIALLFSGSIRETMFFNPVYATIGILGILSAKAYFNTRRSKLAEAVFDITVFRFAFFLSLATAFELFIATTAAALIPVDMLVSLLIAGGLSFFMFLLGLLAGRRPGLLSSVRIFILFSSVCYFIAALSALYYLL